MRLTRRLVKYASFTHSAVYLGLLVTVVTGDEGVVKSILAWTHGLGWFAMCGLVLAALKLRLVDIRLAVAVAVLGGVGPFVGSAEFVRQDRARVGASPPD